MTTTSSTPAPGTLPASRRRWSPRRRQRAFRLAQYALLVIVLVAVALAIDWENVGTNFFNAQAASDIAALIPAAFLKTLEYTFAGFAVGLSLGTLLALMRLSSVGLYRWLAIVYIEFFRGIPALLVVISFGYAVPIAFGVKIPSEIGRAHV